MKSIDIIIVHYGDVEDTKACVLSVEKYSTTYRTLYISNNDPEVLLDTAIAQTKKRVIISASQNNGFAAGVNIGVKKSLQNRADYIVLLNNDTKVQHDFIKPLYRFLESTPEAGIAGPVISFMSKNKALYDYGGKIDMLSGKTTHDNRTSRKIHEPHVVDYVSGCCMMIKKEIFDEIGIFDERFFLYYEDVDFCLRAKKAGYKCFVVTESLIFHRLSKTVGKSSKIALYYQIKSALLFGNRYATNKVKNKMFIISQLVKFIIKNPWNGIHAIKAFF